MTQRRKDCVICGASAGTDEHIFPSALGGRVTNSGIYCPAHNQALGSHVNVLQDQIGLFNAMLGVEPHRGPFRPFIANTDEGVQYAVAGADIRPAPDLDAILDSYVIGESKQLKLDPALLPKLKARAEARGLKLEVTSKSAVQREYRLDAIKLPQMMGGDDGMRAVAYLALTFVAHFWPDVARLPGLSRIKRMLRSGATYAADDRIAERLPASEFVSWSPVRNDPPELVHPSGLGHTVVVCIREGRVLAYIALLDLQCFTVHLGEIDTAFSDRSVVLHIDPLRKGYKEHWTVYTMGCAVLDGAVDPAYLQGSVLESDRMQMRFQETMQRVMARRDRADASAAARQFAAANRLLGPQRRAAMRSFVEGRGQLIVNKIVMFAQHANIANPVGAIVRRAALAAVTPDPSSADGLNPFARDVLDHVVSRISDQLTTVGPDFVLDQERYSGLFTGEFTEALVMLALLEKFSEPSAEGSS